MTRIYNDPGEFAEEALTGFAAAHRATARRVHGGVIRATRATEPQVAVITGGGSGHYPAFAGWLGPGIAHGVACGNVFASPAVAQIYSVCKAAHQGRGLLVSFGNYAGDVLHFSNAAERLRNEGIDVRIVPITDDVASAPRDRESDRRGIAGDLMVLKVTGSAAAEGAELAEVERLARRANSRTRTLGVAFAGCTLPGASAPLFTVAEGEMSIGLGIHGEPGISEKPMGTAAQIAAELVEAVLAEAPGDTQRIAVLLDGLGTVKYEELFVVYASVSQLLEEAGYEIVAPEVGEQCTSLDMAGLSLTVMYLDEELEHHWQTACDTPAFKRGSVSDHGALATEPAESQSVVAPIAPGSAASQAAAAVVSRGLLTVADLLAAEQKRLGDLDAVAGDGDHGIGMARGSRAALESCAASRDAGAGVRTTLERASEAWSERAGGTSGALWGAALAAVAATLDDEAVPSLDGIYAAVAAVREALGQLGGAVPGDKTMMDAVVPFADALAAAQSEGPGRAWAKGVAAARAGADGTKEFAAKLGRSRVLGDKSIGTPDPGAESFALVVEALAPAISRASKSEGTA